MHSKYFSIRNPWLLLFFIAFIATFLRFYKITQVPASLYYDEVDLSYQARSLIQTHKDYRGKQSPFYELTFNDPKEPLPIVLSIPTTLIFRNEELQVRATPALMGVLATLLAFLLTRAITKNLLASSIVGFTFATNPWQIQFSRWAVEAIFSTTFYLASYYIFVLAIQKKKFNLLCFSAVLFSLTVYTYRIMSFFIPLTFAILFLVYRKDLFSFGWRKLLAAAVIPLIMITSFLYATTIGAPDIPRIAQLAIFSDPRIPITIQRDRELDSNDFQISTIGKSASKLSYFFHNKPLSYSRAFFSNYLRTFSSDFLFLDGSGNSRESVGQMGELFYIDIFAFVAGLFFLIKNIRKKNFLFIFILFLIAPIPSSVTIDGAEHGSRLLIFSLPLLLIVGLGWWTIIRMLSKVRYSKILYGVLIFSWVLCFLFYYHRYLTEYPIESAQNFGYGFKQTMLEVGKTSKNYNYVFLSSTNDPPIIYFLFWNHIPPKELQTYGSQFNIGKNYGKSFDKYKVVNLRLPDEKSEENLGKTLQKGILYVFAGSDFPKELHSKNQAPEGINIIDIVKYPNGESAFYLLERKG